MGWELGVEGLSKKEKGPRGYGKQYGDCWGKEGTRVLNGKGKTCNKNKLKKVRMGF